MSTLLVTQGQHLGRRFSLPERTRIGRAVDNDIVLTDHLVSRYHAEILRSGLHFDVRDLGSKNGMQVNGADITEKRLYRGDTLRVGKTLFAFEALTHSSAARFSDTMVVLEAREDESTKILDRAHLPQTPRDESTDFLLRLGRLFECDTDDLPEAVNTSLHQLMELFGATGGAILLRNSSGDATPLAAVMLQGGELSLANQVLQLVVGEGKAALTSALAHGEGEEAPRLRPRKAMLLPLMQRERVFGALYLERPEGKDFTAEDLGYLHALARLVAGAVHHAIQMDQLVLATFSASPAEPFVGVSAVAEGVRIQIQRVAAGDSTVLLTGETGTGKELVAQAIHAASPRANRPFVPIDCASIPANLMESELFGYEAGAFTGADRLKRGKIEMAEGGTLFFDELGEMQIDLQPKLLRFIEDLSYYRVGGLHPMRSDVRIIAATNRDLAQAVQEGRFRQDLLFRLNVMPFKLAPLRERPEDVRALVEHFAPRLAARVGKPFLGLLDEAWALLERYPWPGNVRELRHGLERALILSDDGILRPEHFQLTIPELASSPISEELRTSTQLETVGGGLTRSAGPVAAAPVPPDLATVEAEAIRRAMRYAGGNRVRASEILKIHRNTLAKKIQDYGLE